MAKGKDGEPKFLPIPLNGKWIPAADGTELGQGNFQTLSNMRYGMTTPKTIGGMSKINTVALGPIKNGIHFKKGQPSESHMLVQAVNGGSTSVYDNQTAIPNQGNFGPALWQDSPGAGLGRFSMAPDGCAIYSNGVDNLIWGGNEYRCGAFFCGNNNGQTIYADYTDVVNNTLQDVPGDVALLTVGPGPSPYYVYLGSTRPIEGAKFYIGTGNGNVNAAATTAVNYWTSGAWYAVTNLVDGTSSGGKTLTQTGSISFSSTVGVAKPTLINNVYAYFYQFVFTGISSGTRVYYVTTDAPLQPLVDLWDGSPHPIAAFLISNGSINADYSTNVLYQDYAAGNNATYAALDNLSTSDSLFVGFAEPMTALYMQFAPNMGNVNGTASKPCYVYWWDGAAWNIMSGINDGTVATINGSSKSFAQSGVISWDEVQKNSEVTQSINGLPPFYYYKIVFMTSSGPGTLSAAGQGGTGTVATTNGLPSVSGTGTAFTTQLQAGDMINVGSQAAGIISSIMSDMLLYTTSYFTTTATGQTFTFTAPVALDYIYGVPVQKTLRPYKFPLMWQNRLVLCNDQSEKRNSILIGGQDSAHIFNGADTSEMVFGDDTDIVASGALFARFAGSVYQNLIVCKNNETWLVDGTSISSYIRYKISEEYGCIAPLSFVICDIGFDIGGGITKHVAIWLSATGIVIFDLNTVARIDWDIQNYFDSAKPEYVNRTYLDQSRAWFDEQYHEYHIVLPSGNTPSWIELVYDLLQKKWYKVDRGQALDCAFPVIDMSGNKYIYAGTSGGNLELLENGDTFDGTAITSEFETPDIPLGGMGIVSEIRSIKLITKAKNNTSASVAVTHYADTANSSDMAVNFSVKDTTRRMVQPKQTVNWQNGVFHSIDCQITTNNEACGFEPVALGVFVREIRDDIK